MRALSALLCSATLLLACDRPDPLAKVLVVPDRSAPAPFHDFDWRGDTAHLAASSGVYPRLSVRGQAAFLRLGNARVFTSGGIGPRGATSPFARAFRLLLAEPLSEPAFLELSRCTSAVPQLYGLAGLQLVAPERFSALVPALRLRTDSVPVLHGCIGASRPFVELLDSRPSHIQDLLHGGWPRDLAGLPPGA